MTLKSKLSTSIKPGDDFYTYVNSHWLSSNPMPANKARYGVWDKLSDTNLENLKSLLESTINSNEPLEIQLAKQYYQSGMDESAIADFTPKFVNRTVNDIQSISSKEQLTDFIIKQRSEGLGQLWQTIIEPDDKDSSRYMVRLWQGGLGMPEKTYYLEDNEKFKTIRKHYHDYLRKFFELIELDNPTQRAKNVYKIELALAKASRDAADCRDAERAYNPFSLEKLHSTYKNVNWGQYFGLSNLDIKPFVLISQPEFFDGVNQLLADEPIESWQDYLLFNSIAWLGDKLSKPFEDLNFSFYGKILSGRQEQEPRYRRIAQRCMGALPEPTGRLFVEHYFNESAKVAVNDLVTDLQVALKSRLEKLEWMGQATKEQATEKLSTFLTMMGYPDKWRDYEGLSLGSDYAANLLEICKFDWQFEASRLGKPVNKEEWQMSPALINAYYWANTNGITFPAGILQPPFFNANGDFAANYGAIGAVIGHELTHGFDDEGSKFDAYGNMKSWWSEEDRKNFDARAKKLAKQYDGYELAGRHLNGQLTLGENIADLGGLLIAYDALQNKLDVLGNRDEIDGLTPEQRFFISFAFTWCAHMRDELALLYIVSDPHSPNYFRVNGVVPNIDAFYEAFDVQPGDKLYVEPDKRVRIW